MNRSLIQKNQLDSSVEDLVAKYGSGYFLPLLYSGIIVNIESEKFVITTGLNQNISGVKNFDVRPTVSGIGVLLQGEATVGSTNSGLRYILVQNSINLLPGLKYAIDTSSQSFSVNLPINPITGDNISILDYNDTFDINNLIVNRNNTKIEKFNENLVCDVKGSAFDLIYTDINNGWHIVPQYATVGPIQMSNYIGPKGDIGATGPTGSAVLNGTLDPLPQYDIGRDGDFFINTLNNKIFGPRTNNSWGMGVSLIGPIGPTGSQGSTGATGATGSLSPVDQTKLNNIQELASARNVFVINLCNNINFLFSDSGYTPGNPSLGFFSLNPLFGNTVFGTADSLSYGSRYFWFNPEVLLSHTFSETYRITMIVRVSNAINDGIHCRLVRRLSDNSPSSIVPGLQDFGGGGSGGDRRYIASSDPLTVDGNFYSFRPDFAAYNALPGGGGNSAIIQDVTLLIHTL